MAKKSGGLNLSEAIRGYRKAHRGVSAKDALAAIKKAHPNEKINEGTFKSTFYKLAAGVGKRTVRRRKPGRALKANGGGGHTGDGGHAVEVMSAGLHFIRLSGGVEQAREQLAGLMELIETAKVVR
jgi:hypothetical protein